ncbi:MAG: hypothetical protein ACE5K0_06285 [Candidatus Methanofastidiosia archaeon]
MPHKANTHQVFEELEDAGICVLLSNPSKTKAIASLKINNDKISAGILADLLRSNLIAKSYVPPRKTESMQFWQNISFPTNPQICLERLVSYGLKRL